MPPGDKCCSGFNNLDPPVLTSLYQTQSGFQSEISSRKIHPLRRTGIRIERSNNSEKLWELGAPNPFVFI